MPRGRSAFDALRSLAGLAVLIGHALPGPLTMAGGPFGVALFFVLSGYLIWRPFVAASPNVATYARHRAARILPAYLLAVVILVPARELFSYLTFTQGFSWTVAAPLHASWTLVVEIAFYFLAPILAPFGPRALLLIGGASLPFALVAAATPDPATVSMLVPARLWQFLPGMALAIWRPVTTRTWLQAGVALSALTWLLSPILPDQGAYLNLPAVAASYFLVGWAVGRDVPFRRLAAVGAVLTYPVYLWHQDLIARLGAWPGIAATLTIGSLSYRLLERPILRLAREQPRRVLGAVRVPR